jgi:hypothetical protein
MSNRIRLRLLYAIKPLKLDEHATPAMKVLSDEMQTIRSEVEELRLEISKGVVQGATISGTIDSGMKFVPLRVPLRHIRPPSVAGVLDVVMAPDDKAHPDVIEEIIRLMSTSKIEPTGVDKIAVRFKATDKEMAEATIRLKSIRGVLEVDRR